jgi:hypothetical protein
VLDRLYVDPITQKIQPPLSHSRPKRCKGKFQNGYCLSALKAVTGARGYLTGRFPTLTIAALSCGSHKDSVAAALVILKTEDNALLADVLSGHVPLLSTARSMKHAVELIDAFRQSDTTELQIFGRAIGPERIFDQVVIPTL